MCVGSSLANVAHRFGYKQEEGCGCEEVARKYDEWGVEKCEENFDAIINELEGRAHKLGYTFSRTVAIATLKSVIVYCKARPQITPVIQAVRNTASTVKRACGCSRH